MYSYPRDRTFNPHRVTIKYSYTCMPAIERIAESYVRYARKMVLQLSSINRVRHWLTVKTVSALGLGNVLLATKFRFTDISALLLVAAEKEEETETLVERAEKEEEEAKIVV